MFDINKTLRN